MKRILTLWLALSPVIGFSQVSREKLSSQQVHSLTLLGELWGFLKYYHPAVAQGQQDWDSVLIQKIPLFLGAKDKNGIDQLTTDWLTETGTPAPCPSCDNKVPDSCKFNLDFSWINEHNFSKEVADRLLFIRDNRNQGHNRFVEQPHYSGLLIKEKAYATPAFQYPAAGYRLLLLFRYWNIVHYFSPYKYICGKDWKKVLEEKIPAFYGAADTAAYQVEYVKLIGSLNDGHANYYATPVLQRFWGENHFPPFICWVIDGQLVVNKILNDSLAALIRIKTGDVLLTVNGEKVSDKRTRLQGYAPSSNDIAKVSHFSSYFLFTTPDSNIIITKKRKGLTITDSFRMPPFKEAHHDGAALPWRMLGNNIGYVNAEDLGKSQVDPMMDAFAGAKGIILDLRNYPGNIDSALVAHLCTGPFVKARISYADLDYPGVFRFREEWFRGQLSPHRYTGKVVLLADESSVSHSEWLLMTLQAATKTTTIGSTTAGQDGDISQRIILPGFLFTRFSSLGVYYPDGTCAQRTGVRIDKTVIPTIHGLEEGRDEVLEAAVSFINGRQ